MKNLIILLLCVCTFNIHAQTYDEWFRQKATQKKYLIEQIAALQTYAGYVEKGYKIARKGLKAMEQIKHGDLKLHTTFINSLSSVNPRVKNYVRVADIIALQLSIATLVTKTIRHARKGQLTFPEINYLQQVFNKVLDEGAKNLNELSGLIASGGLQMKDDERIKRIDKLYGDMQEMYVFVQSFSHSAKGLSIQRRNDLYNIQIEKKLNGLQ